MPASTHNNILQRKWAKAKCTWCHMNGVRDRIAISVVKHGAYWPWSQRNSDFFSLQMCKLQRQSINLPSKAGLFGLEALKSLRALLQFQHGCLVINLGISYHLIVSLVLPRFVKDLICLVRVDQHLLEFCNLGFCFAHHPFFIGSLITQLYSLLTNDPVVLCHNM
jgi:hypothetical protein